MIIESGKRGLVKGLKTLWRLTKIVVPVYFLVTFLKMTSILGIISTWFEPIMKILGLPGEASVALVIGNSINLYAGIGAMTGLDLTIKQATIVAVMLSFSHSLFLETAVAKKTGLSVAFVLAFRIGLAIVSGIILNIIL